MTLEHLTQELLETLPDETPVRGLYGQPEKTIGEIKAKGITAPDIRNFEPGTIYAVDYFVEVEKWK